MKKRIICILTCIALLISAICIPFDTEAASAKSILNKAYKEMKKSDTIFYCYNTNYKDNGKRIVAQEGFSISDINISHSFGEDEHWHIKSRVYSKYSWSDDWTIKKTDYDNSAPEKYYGKKSYQYVIKNLKNPVIKKSTKSSYIIEGDMPLSDLDYKKVEITVSKKDKRINAIIIYFNDFTQEDDSGNKHKITDIKWEITNICYGKGKLKKPSF